MTRSYGEWPMDPAARRRLAREIFAAEISTIRKKGQKHGELLLSGWLPKRPTVAQTRLADWAANLSADEREHIQTLMSEAIAHSLFGLLVTLDGASGGGRLPEATSTYRLILDVTGETGRTESLRVNDPEDGDLHDELWPKLRG